VRPAKALLRDRASSCAPLPFSRRRQRRLSFLCALRCSPLTPPSHLPPLPCPSLPAPARALRSRRRAFASETQAAGPTGRFDERAFSLLRPISPPPTHVPSKLPTQATPLPSTHRCTAQAPAAPLIETLLSHPTSLRPLHHASQHLPASDDPAFRPSPCRSPIPRQHQHVFLSSPRCT
jgi:hypothetical protein